MPTAPDPSAGTSAYEIFGYLGSFIAAIVAGWLGYLKGRPEHRTTTTIAGALVDNQALTQVVGPILDALNRLIIRLDALTIRADKLLDASERDAEEERQQERVDRAVHAALERLMREPPADMPPVRR